MISPKTIRLVHPHLDNVTSEGVIIHELGHYFDEKHQFSSSKQFTKLYKKYRTLFNQKTKKEYFAECFKEYVGGHQEKVKPFHSYMKTITQKETKGGKNDEKKTNENGRYCRYRGGCTGTCLHCSTDIFCGAAKKDVSGVLGTAK